MNIPETHTINRWIDMINEHLPDMFLAIVRVITILVVYFILKHFISKLINRFFEAGLARLNGSSEDNRKSRVKALKTVVSSIAGFVLAFTCVIMILQGVGVNIMPVVTTAGVAGLAIGIGAQKMVKDLIAGFFLLVEDQYGVGEIVSIDTITGEVVELGMRTTKIRDASNRLCFISNGDIIRVINHSRGSIVAAVDVSVQLSADSAIVQNILAKICEEVSKSSSAVTMPFKIVGIVKNDALSTTFRLAGSVSAKSEFEIRNMINKLIKEEFAANAVMLA